MDTRTVRPEYVAIRFMVGDEIMQQVNVPVDDMTGDELTSAVCNSVKMMVASVKFEGAE